jgi:hypothetical protein
MKRSWSRLVPERPTSKVVDIRLLFLDEQTGLCSSTCGNRLARPAWTNQN